jgi:hypothetical protein
MKHNYPIALGLAIFFSFLSFKAQATHFQGAEFRYECLSSCVYRVYFTAYRSCDNPANLPGLPPLVNVSPPPGCSAPTALDTAYTFASLAEVTPLCPGTATQCSNPNAQFVGVAEEVWYRDYDFCSSPCPQDNFTFTWISCCRPYSITSGASGDAMYLEMELNKGQSPCNNSPIFNTPGVLYVSPGTGGVLDLSAYDPDGDSLVYELVPCMDNSTTPVGYSFGHSPANPLGPGWTVSFDTLTGLLTAFPSPTGMMMHGVLCVEVKEYRNGNYLGSLTRDLDLLVVGFVNGDYPVFDSILSVNAGNLIGPNHFQVCIGDSLGFDFAFSDPDAGQLVCLSTNADSALAGSVFTQTCGNPGTGNIHWVPDTSAYGKTHIFYVLAEDDFCNVPAKGGQAFYVTVGGPCLLGDVTHTVCNDSIGAIDITFNGTTPPYTYLWNTGDTTEDLTALPAGQYWVTVTDAVGGMYADTFFVNAIDLLLNPLIDPVSCNAPDGNINLTPSGGTAPYTYAWSNGQSGAAATGLAAGGYSVVVTDQLGCVTNEVFLLDPPDSCYVSIEGTVFADANGNCVQDPGELGIPYVAVDVTPGGAVFTDSLGHYYYEADSGNVDVSVVLGSYMSYACPSSGTHNLYFVDYDADTAGVDFALDFMPVQDLKVNVNNPIAFPGQVRTHHVLVTNEGSLTMDGTLKVTYDSLESLFFAQGNPTGNNPATQELEWDFFQLPPGSFYLYKYFTITDSTAQIGDTLCSMAQVLPIVGDTTPGNNADTICEPLLNSYDPNDKLVEPAGIRDPGYILPTQNQMDYTVRFQNTGTFQALYVEIRDTLDSSLDPFSFRPGSYSHPYALSLEHDSILVFTFANINLPDSASDPVGSQGFVGFSLRHQGVLSPGTVIENSAAIYFDYNPPVITNTTVNTIFEYPEVVMTLKVDSLCEGENITAAMTESGMPPYEYVWNNSIQGAGDTTGIFALPVQESGWYQLKITDAYGFEAEDSLQLTVLPEPVADFTYEWLDGYTVEFTNHSQHANQYTWDFGDGGPLSTDENPVHTYAFGAFYTVILTAINDCGNSELNTQVQDLEDELFARSIRVIPNPFSQSTEIHFANPQGRPFFLRLYDLQGKRQRQYSDLRGERVLISREDLPAGLYLFELDGPQQFSGKLMIR